MNNNASKTNAKRFNIADIIIILTAVIILSLLVFIFFRRGILPAQHKIKDITYTVTLENLPTAYHGAINKGDSVYDDKTGVLVGTVAHEPDYHTSSVEKYDKDAQFYKQYTYPDKENVTVIIRVNAEYANGHYSVNGLPVSTGTEFSLRVPDLIYKARITKVSAPS